MRNTGSEQLRVSVQRARGSHRVPHLSMFHVTRHVRGNRLPCRHLPSSDPNLARQACVSEVGAGRKEGVHLEVERVRAGAPRVGRAAAQQSCLGAFERVECVDLRLRTCQTDAVESGLQAASRASRRRASSPSYVTESTLVGIGAGWLVPMSGAAG